MVVVPRLTTPVIVAVNAVVPLLRVTFTSGAPFEVEDVGDVVVGAAGAGELDLAAGHVDRAGALAADGADGDGPAVDQQPAGEARALAGAVQGKHPGQAGVDAVDRQPVAGGAGDVVGEGHVAHRWWSTLPRSWSVTTDGAVTATVPLMIWAAVPGANVPPPRVRTLAIRQRALLTNRVPPVLTVTPPVPSQRRCP